MCWSRISESDSRSILARKNDEKGRKQADGKTHNSGLGRTVGLLDRIQEGYIVKRHTLRHSGVVDVLDGGSIFEMKTKLHVVTGSSSQQQLTTVKPMVCTLRLVFEVNLP